MNDHVKPGVWGVFVGDRGSDLDSFNSASGPFPPPAGAEGYIAIGWPGVGNMAMFANDYPGFVERFRKLYSDGNERTLKTQANMVWSFAFTMKPGDYVICPSTATGYVLIGRISGSYENDAENWVSVARYKKRHDLMHLRRIQWECAIPTNDPAYKTINRIGQLTVVNPDISVEDLLELIARFK